MGLNHVGRALLNRGVLFFVDLGHLSANGYDYVRMVKALAKRILRSIPRFIWYSMRGTCSFLRSTIDRIIWNKGRNTGRRGMATIVGPEGAFPYDFRHERAPRTYSSSEESSCTGSRKKREPPEPVLYAFERSDAAHGKMRLYKVGKSKSVSSRMKSYKTLDPQGTMVYKVQCKDIDFAEKILHMILKRHGYHHQREVFLIDKKSLIQYMDSAQRLADFLCQSHGDSHRLWKACKALP